MSCQITHERSAKVIHDHHSCIACRPDNHKQDIEPLLTPGVLYAKCTLLVKPESGCEPLTALANIDTEKDRIVGITKCEVDLTDVTEADNYPCRILTHVGLDPNYICWPEGTTVEQIDMLMRNMKDCVWFVNRMQCAVVPDEYLYLLDTTEVVESKATSKTADSVPVSATKQTAKAKQ